MQAYFTKVNQVIHKNKVLVLIYNSHMYDSFRSQMYFNEYNIQMYS